MIKTGRWGARTGGLAMAVVAALVLARTALGGDAFLTALGDLPLAPGLEEQTDATTAFDTPAGRIVEAYAAGPVDRNAVLDFYARTLPQLGWRRSGDTTFTREGERLEIDIPAGASGGVTVRFALSPATETP